MGTQKIKLRYSWFLLLAGLAISTGQAWAASARPAGNSDGTTAAGPVQGGKESTGQQAAQNPKRVVDDYRIGPSDVLAINVWKDAELTRTSPCARTAGFRCLW